MKILIVKLAALGDVLRTTSLLRPLHARHPGCEVWWVTSAAALPLLEGDPWIQEALTLEEASASPPAGFDLVLSLEEDETAARLAMGAGGELVGVVAKDGGGLGYTASSAPYYDMSLLNGGAGGSMAAADALKAANVRTFAEIWLGVLGLPAPKDRSLIEPVLSLTNADRRGAWEVFRRGGIDEDPIALGINTGAGRRWPAKQLSEERAAALLDALADVSGRPLVLFGGPDEAQRNARILKLTRARVIDAGTGHPLRTFAALIDLCAALVTADTLAFHMATALRKEAVVFVGPTSAAELDVYGRGVKLAPAERCSCFYKTRCTLPESCLDRIPLDRFVKAVARCLP